MDSGNSFDSGRMNETRNLSPISLHIALLWIRLISTLWFNMVIQPAALASPGA
jgi:hypothetical protein